MLRLRQYKEIYTSELISRAGQGSTVTVDSVTASSGGFLSSKKRKRNCSETVEPVALGGREAGHKSGNKNCMTSLQSTLTQGIQFHILELIGSGNLTRTAAPRGELLRLSR
jgi:hypothetical protein